MSRFPTHDAWVAIAVVAACGAALAQGGSVAETPHNLSVSGPGEFRSTSETEICKFCHIPHNALVPQPLWSHELTQAQFAMPELRNAAGGRRASPQPDGSSRLCLSCHDGTVALGDVAGEPRTIPMAAADRLGPQHRGYIGTDLSGSHPISFSVADSARALAGAVGDIGLKSIDAIHADQDVRLDGDGKMQCTTCHDPHSDRYHVEGEVPRFWVKPTVDDVCLTCHDLN